MNVLLHPGCCNKMPHRSSVYRRTTLLTSSTSVVTSLVSSHGRNDRPVFWSFYCMNILSLQPKQSPATHCTSWHYDLRGRHFNLWILKIHKILIGEQRENKKEYDPIGKRGVQEMGSCSGNSPVDHCKKRVTETSLDGQKVVQRHAQ